MTVVSNQKKLKYKKIGEQYDLSNDEICVEYNINGFDINEFFFISEDHDLNQNMEYTSLAQRLVGLKGKTGKQSIDKDEKLFRF